MTTIAGPGYALGMRGQKTNAITLPGGADLHAARRKQRGHPRSVYVHSDTGPDYRRVAQHVAEPERACDDSVGWR